MTDNAVTTAARVASACARHGVRWHFPDFVLHEGAEGASSIEVPACSLPDRITSRPVSGPPRQANGSRRAASPASPRLRARGSGPSRPRTSLPNLLSKGTMRSGICGSRLKQAFRTSAAGRVVACRVRKAKSWPGPLRLASRRRASIDGPFADAPSHSSAKARCAGLASSSLPTTSAGTPGSVASAARRSGPNGEACGTPSTNRRAFAGSSMMLSPAQTPDARHGSWDTRKTTWPGQRIGSICLTIRANAGSRGCGCW